jgi:hypothetical protein
VLLDDVGAEEGVTVDPVAVELLVVLELEEEDEDEGEVSVVAAVVAAAVVFAVLLPLPATTPATAAVAIAEPRAIVRVRRRTSRWPASRSSIRLVALVISLSRPRRVLPGRRPDSVLSPLGLSCGLSVRASRTCT